MTQATFNELMAQAASPGADGHCRVTLTADWLQGRAGFGGLMAALAVTSLRAVLDDQRPLRALMTAFVGPPGPGELVIECRQLRSGKSVTWAEARVLQAGQVCTTVTACLGLARESVIQVAPPALPDVAAVDAAQPFPYLEGITPAFTQHFEMRWALGGLPVTGSERCDNAAWIRFRDGSAFAEAHVIAFMDLLPPAVLQMFAAPRPISSLSWHLEMLDDLRKPDAQDGDGWWLFHVAAHGAADGYSQQQATLYTPGGRALALSQQAIAVFA